MTESLLQKLEAEVGKCISCGFCESVCPTLSPSGYDLWKGARGRVLVAKELANDLRSGSNGILHVSDSFYSCLDCYACLYVCPAGVNAGIVSHTSREIIASGMLPENENPVAKMIVSTTMKYLNPLGVREKASRWAEGLNFNDNSPDLLYTGNMFQLMPYTKNLNSLRNLMGRRMSKFMAGLVGKHPSLIGFIGNRRDMDLDARMSQSLRNIVELLESSGLNVKYLGSNEPYPGTFIYDLGYADQFRIYAEKVTKILKDSGAKRIITIDPHTFDLLKNTYPKFVRDFDFEVVHYIDLIKDLDFGKSGEKVTFHEPCHLVLRESPYNSPMDLLRQTSEVVLPARSGRKTRCCGGPNELLFPELSEKISEQRYGELRETGASRVVTACPICFTNLAKDEKTIEISDFLIEKLRK